MLRAFRLALGRRSDVESEVRDEIEHHVQLTIESLVAAGATPAAAREEALRRLGHAPSIDDVHRRLLSAAQRREHRMRFHDRLDIVRDDTRYALRQMRRSPGFAAAVIITFALGIGANATMFGLVDRLLLRPPAGVAAPGRVFALTSAWQYRLNEPGNGRPASDQSELRTANQETFSFPVYKGLRDVLLQPGTGVEEIAGTSWSPVDVSLGTGADARRAKAALVTASFFPTLGVRPERGRFFRPDEDVEPVGAPVIVISHSLWHRAFGGADTVLGTAVDIGKRRFTIIGVAPRGFTGNEVGAVDLWMLISGAEGVRFIGTGWATTRNATWIRVFARFAPGASTAEAVSRANVVNLELGEPRMASLGARIIATPLTAAMRNADQKVTEKVATLLAAVSAFVLLIAAANVANLLLARALRRRQEIAVRLALGISRARLVGQLLTESILLAVLGGIGALLVVHWGGMLVRALILPDYGWDGSPVDTRVLGYTFAAALLTGIVTGLVPAIQASAPALTAALGNGARGMSVRRLRTRSALLVAQAALAVVLLTGAGLFVRSVRNLDELPIGMEPDRVLLAEVNLRPLGLTWPEIDAIFRRLEQRVTVLPGVERAALAATVAGRGSIISAIFVAGRDSLPKPAGGGPYLNAVRPGYFATMGTRLIRGRDFTDADDAPTAPRVVIINETLARLVWADRDPIGECIRVGADTMPCMTIVGIAQNSRRQDWVEEEIFHVYMPLATGTSYWMPSRLLVVRPRGDRVEQLIPELRRAVQDVAPNMPYAEIRVLESLYAGELRPWKLGATMFGAFGALAVLLAAVGLYGVIALDVTQRTRELGVRIALGARSANVVRLVMRHAVLVVALGAALGIAVALAAGPTIEPLLFRVSSREPAIYLAVVVLLLVVALIASMLPSWRATRVDPAVALRAE